MQGEQRGRVRLIRDLDIKVPGLLFYPGKVFVDIGCIDDHHVAIASEMINNQVIDGTSIRQAELGVERLVNSEARNVVWDKVLQESKCIFTLDFEFTHVADIKEAGACTHRAVLFQDAAILHWHFPAAELHEARP